MFLCLIVFNTVYSQNTSYNFVHSIKTRSSQKTNVQINNPNLSAEIINYYDGLGRPIQVVAKQQNPNQKDIISFKQYDGYGREQYTYLPFCTTQNNGGYSLTPNTSQAAFYNSVQPGIKQNAVPYENKKFENSPLNRVVEIGYSGANFQVGNALGTSKNSFRYNDVNDNILMWGINNNNIPEVEREYSNAVLGVSECYTSFSSYQCNPTYNSNQVVSSTYLGYPRQGSVSDMCFAFYYNGTANTVSQNTFQLSNFSTPESYCRVSFYLLKPNSNSNSKLYVRDMNTSKIIYSVNNISSSAYSQHIFIYKSNGNVNIQFEVVDGDWGNNPVINSDIVILDDITLKAILSVTPGPVKYYSPNTLQIVESKDENGNIMESFTDIYGKTILQRSKLNAQWVETYYVYNDNEQLQATIQPEAVKQLPSYNFNLTQNNLYEKYVFNTIYDERMRPVIKKIPGKEEEYFVYNIKDQIVLKQDGKLRNQNSSNWFFYKYDELGRVVYSGITAFQEDYLRAQLQELINNYTTKEQLTEVRTGSGYQYTNRVFPSQLESEIFVVNYYDNYPNLSITGNITAPVSYNSRTIGLPTRTIYKLILSDGTIDNSRWYSKYNYYDSKARIINTVEEHDGVVEKKSNAFDFEDNLLSTNTVLETSNGNTTIIKSYTYDHANRLISISQKINNEPTVVLANYIYNALGTLYKKNYNVVNGKPLFSNDISYTERGWTNKIDYYWSKDRQECNQVQLFDVNELKSLINSSEQDQEIYHNSDIETWALHKAGIFVDLLDQFGFPEDLYPEIYLPHIEGRGDTPKEIFKDQVSILLYTEFLNNNIDVPNTPLEETNVLVQNILDLILDETIAHEIVYNECFTVTDRFNLFNEQMFYETPSINNTNGAQFNGNISSVRWQTANLPVSEYSYSYDHTNRLTDADYFEKVSNQWISSIKYDVANINYDANGNILTIKQKGAVSQSGGVYSYGLIDDLNYTYDGNILKSVVDFTADGSNERKDFKDGNTTDLVGVSNIEYLYDANGNMIADLNKDMIILYNHMNMPSKITFSSGNIIEYIYDPFGVKRLQKISTYNSSANSYSTITKKYVGNVLFENGNISYIVNEEGISQKVASTYIMQYSLKDHLGNLRMSVKADANNEPIILQYDSYYPFGLEMGGLSYMYETENKYKYNGKEKQDAFNLNWYDYGARFYDSQLGRWHSVDPLSEKYYSYSPMTYCANNPIKFVDVNGMEFIGDIESVKSLVAQAVSNVIAEMKLQADLCLRYENRQAKGKSTTSIERRLKQSELRQKEYQNTIFEIDEMDKSSTIYNVNTNYLSNTEDGSTSYGGVNKNGNIIINVNVSQGYLIRGGLAHELVHAYQFETGNLDFSPNGSPGALYDLYDEQQAYVRQYAFANDSRMFGVTKDYIKGIRNNSGDFLYNRLPMGPLNKNSIMAEIYIQNGMNFNLKTDIHLYKNAAFTTPYIFK